MLLVRLRQIALVASELHTTIEALNAELGTDVCFQDPGVGVFGLHNALLALGDTFLEVVSPTEPDTAAGRYLERRGGDGGYMVLLQLSAEERAACRQRGAALNIREVHQAEDTHGGDHIVGTHFHPADTGGAILSIDTATPPESWGWAGAEWSASVRTERAGPILAVEIQSDDPMSLAARWAELLDQPIKDSATVALSDGGEIRFVTAVDGRGDGVASIEVEALDRALADRSAQLAGIRIDWR